MRTDLILALSLKDPSLVLLIISALISLLLLLITVLSYQQSRRQNRELQNRLDAFQNDLKTLDCCSLDNLDIVMEKAETNELPALLAALTDAAEISALRYQGQWLPDLKDFLLPQLCLSPRQLPSYLRGRATWILGAGVFSTILLFFIAPFLPSENPLILSDVLPIILLPLALALLAFLLLRETARSSQTEQELSFQQLQQSIACALPVFDAQSGSALLVNQMLGRDAALGKNLGDLNETLDALVNSRFSEAICQNVRQVMEEEVAPPIQKAAACLQDLAGTLESRQREGMADLAAHFSQELSQSLSSQLQPLHEELAAFRAMMEDTRNFIDDSVAILENSRQQNIKLNHDLTDSLQLMTRAKNDLANEMAEVSDNLKIISQTTERMTTLYAGEEAALSDKIADLSLALDHALKNLREGLNGSTSALELTAQYRLEQERQSSALLNHLDQLSREMKQFSKEIGSASQNFTTESSQYVSQTLKDFDQGLAEVVERLIFTASAIRDAVDALPAALRPNKD